ncbi:hypothetical protein [Crenobacter luteus]|uniref:hypothetical protein n=1 Tax=Crenobacter luteus TaxID=1452487 RepID=UPI0012E7BFBB|nr:hypothetical protein [Crenobacter luteus]
MNRTDAARLNPLIHPNCCAATLESVGAALREVAEVAIDPGDMPREGLLNHAEHGRSCQPGRLRRAGLRGR